MRGGRDGPPRGPRRLACGPAAGALGDEDDGTRESMRRVEEAPEHDARDDGLRRHRPDRADRPVSAAPKKMRIVVTGRVVDAREKPVAGARVWFTIDGPP